MAAQSPAIKNAAESRCAVNSRIRLMFGEDYGLRVFSATGIGTECCVTMPLLMQGD